MLRCRRGSHGRGGPAAGGTLCRCCSRLSRCGLDSCRGRGRLGRLRYFIQQRRFGCARSCRCCRFRFLGAAAACRGLLGRGGHFSCGVGSGACLGSAGLCSVTAGGAGYCRRCPARACGFCLGGGRCLCAVRSCLFFIHCGRYFRAESTPPHRVPAAADVPTPAGADGSRLITFQAAPTSGCASSKKPMVCGIRPVDGCTQWQCRHRQPEACHWTEGRMWIADQPISLSHTRHATAPFHAGRAKKLALQSGLNHRSR